MSTELSPGVALPVSGDFVFCLLARRLRMRAAVAFAFQRRGRPVVFSPPPPCARLADAVIGFDPLGASLGFVHLPHGGDFRVNVVRKVIPLPFFGYNIHWHLPSFSWTKTL